MKASFSLILIWFGTLGHLFGQEVIPGSPPENDSVSAPTDESNPGADPADDAPPTTDDAAPARDAASPPAPVIDDAAYQQILLLTHAMETIREKYVDEEKVSYERLMAGALEGMFASLDPHSSYMHPRVFQQMKERQENSYEGVGIAVARRNQSLEIIAVHEAGPAAAAGVLPGDVILKIGETLVERVEFTEAMQLLAGKPGETLSLVLRRPRTGETLVLEIVRKVMKQDSLADVMMLGNRYAGERLIGYARLIQFNQPSARELAEALNRLEAQGMEAFILDLRNNPGGLLNTAVDICGEFLPPDTTVVTVEGRGGEVLSTYQTKGSSSTTGKRDFPVAILINHSSASASEVVSGALQDLKRAVIVGETSFGKGSVQNIIPVGRGTGAAMRLTVAKYFTPSHRVIHEKGVTPDILVTMTPEEEELLAKWRQSKSLSPAEQEAVRTFHDPQLARATDALKALLIWEKKTAATVKTE